MIDFTKGLQDLHVDTVANQIQFTEIALNNVRLEQCNANQNKTISDLIAKNRELRDELTGNRGSDSLDSLRFTVTSDIHRGSESKNKGMSAENVLLRDRLSCTRMSIEALGNAYGDVIQQNIKLQTSNESQAQAIKELQDAARAATATRDSLKLVLGETRERLTNEQSISAELRKRVDALNAVNEKLNSANLGLHVKIAILQGKNNTTVPLSNRKLFVSAWNEFGSPGSGPPAANDTPQGTFFSDGRPGSPK